MSDAIFWRLVWKEYRFQRAYWLAVAAGAMLIQLIALVSARLASQPTPNEFLFGVALGAAAFYALGCGATLFAAEHETETFHFQRALPLTAARLFAGKAFFGLVSTVSLIALLWCAAVVLTVGQFAWLADERPELWASGALMVVEMLVWGMFFSLRSTGPLKAVVLALAAALLTAHMLTLSLVAAAYRLFSANGLAPWQMLQASLPVRCVLAALVLAADAWLGVRWFSWRADEPSVWASVWERWTRAGRRAISAEQRHYPPAVFSCLLWQQWRQSRAMIAAIGLLPLGVFLWAAWDLFAGSQSPPIEMFPWVVGLAALAGSSVFRGDQQRFSFRFLAERGAAPSKIWLSRQAVWLAALVFWTMVLAALLFVLSSQLRGGRNVLDGVGYSLGLAIIAYAGCQLCSLLFRSSVLAFWLGFALSILLLGWAALMHVARIPLIWSVAPIPIVLVLASWRRTPDWLLERQDWRARLRAAAWLAIPAAVLVAGVCTYRVVQIPLADVGLSLSDLPRPTAEEKETAHMYLRAGGMLTSPKQREVRQPLEGDMPLPIRDWEIAWLKQNAKPLELALRAAARPSCSFYDPSRLSRWESGPSDVVLLGDLLITSGRKAESDGDLDLAFERYRAALRMSIHVRQQAVRRYAGNYLECRVYGQLRGWAGRGDQTIDRLRGAKAELAKIAASIPPPAESVKCQYLLSVWLLSGAVDDLAASSRFNPEQIRFLTLTRILMPWEFSRARRLCAVITKNQLSLWESATAAMRQQKPIAGCFPDYPTFQKSAEWSWWETTPLARLSELNRWARGEGEFESQRRAMQLLLDLHIHRVRAGKLPESLDELAAETPGPLPADAVSGRPLLYFPGGSPSGWREMNEWLERVEEYRDAGRSGSVSHEWRGRVHAEAYFFEAAARPVLWGESTGWIAVGGGK